MRVVRVFRFRMVSGSPPFRRAFPPERPPSRRAVSYRTTPPKVPPHRAPSSHRLNFPTPRLARFHVPLPSPTSESPYKERRWSPQQQQKRLDQSSAEEVGVSSDRQLFGDRDSSPVPLQPHGGSAAGSLQNLNTSTTEHLVGADRSPPRHFYRVALDEEDKARPLNLIGYSIYGSMTMIGIIDVVPSRWRLEMKPYLSPLELHVQRIDVDSFPMRRLWRLIEKLIRREQEDGYANTPFKSRSLKGSLYIHRKDNGHLQFLPSVPAVIPLEGSTVLADVLDLKQLPRDGCSVYLRWIEDSPRVCLVDADSSVSTNGAWGGTGRAEDVNIAVPLPQSPHRAVRQRYGGYSQHRREDCSDKSCEPQLNDNRNRHRTYSPAPVRKSQTHGDGGRMRPESREEQTEASYVLENIDDEEIPPLTFLHTPPMMYRKPWHGVT